MQNIHPHLAGSFGVPGPQEMLVILIIIALQGTWIWSIVHCVRNKTLKGNDRIIAIAVVVGLGIVGTILYFALFANRKLEKIETGEAPPPNKDIVE